MAKQRTIPRVEDDTTNRAIKALSDSVSELIRDQQDIPETPYGVAQVVPLVTLRAAANVAIDGSKSNNYRLVLDQNVTVANPTGVQAGQIINLSLIQDPTGGFTVDWDSAWEFSGGVKVTTAAASAKDFVSARVETVSPSGTATLILGLHSQAYS